jgi:hypothetical protein
MSFQFASPLDPTPSTPSLTCSTVRFRTDGTNLRITVATSSPLIPMIDQRRFRNAAVWVGLRAFRNRDDILPVFAVRVGGWYASPPGASSVNGHLPEDHTRLVARPFEANRS